MIRLLFVVFVTLGGFAAVALWTARGGDTRGVVGEVLPEGVGSAVRAEAVRLGRNVAALLPDIEPIAGESASRAGDSGSGGHGAAAVAEPEPTSEEVHDDGAPGEVQDIAPLAEFARDLGGSNDLPEGGAPALAGDGQDAGAWSDGENLTPLRGPDESAGLIRRMLALYPRARE